MVAYICHSSKRHRFVNLLAGKVKWPAKVAFCSDSVDWSSTSDPTDRGVNSWVNSINVGRSKLEFGSSHENFDVWLRLKFAFFQMVDFKRLPLIDHSRNTITNHNALCCVTPKFFISMVFSFSWELKWPQAKRN